MQTKNTHSPIDKLVISAAKKGVTITNTAPLRWSLVNQEGRKAALAPHPEGGYGLVIDGYEAVEAQYGEDAYTKRHAWQFGALCHAVAHLR